MTDSPDIPSTLVQVCDCEWFPYVHLESLCAEDDVCDCDE